MAARASITPFMELALATAGLLIGSALYAFIARRSAKSMRQASDPDWKRQWRALDRRRRKSIRGSLRRGEAVRDPADVDLALGAVAQIERVRGSMRMIENVSWVLFAGLLVALLALGQTGLAIGLAVVLAALGVASVVSAWQWRRFRKAAEATRRLASR